MKIMNILVLLIVMTTEIFSLNKITKKYEVTINNPLRRNDKDLPISIKLKDFKADFRVRSAIVSYNDNEIPSQLDDINGDGHNDELAFLLDMKGELNAIVEITLCNLPSDKKYESRIYADMILNDKNQKFPSITSLSSPGVAETRPYYDVVYLHGPIFESELVGYRVYYDNRQSIDIYGKIKGYGADVLWAGQTVSLGSFRGWDPVNKQPLYIDDVKTRQESLRAAGPVRTITEVKDYDWYYEDHYITMTQYYTLWAGHRDVKVEIFFEDKLTNETFCTGVQKLETNISGFLNGKGIAGSWGINQPEKGKDIFETVGLGIYMPNKYIKDNLEDDGNYLFNIGNDGNDYIHYYITFCNKREELGWKINSEWFEHVKDWAKMKNEDDENPITYSIKAK